MLIILWFNIASVTFPMLIIRILGDGIQGKTILIKVGFSFDVK